MVNVQTKVEGGVLTITVNLKERHGVSASGKSETVASTGGNVTVGDGYKLGLNVYLPR